MTLNNHSDAVRTLVGASSPAFGNVMLHRTVMEGGTAKMVHQMAIEIPANGSVTFEPNGYHLMLMKPKQQLKAGDKVDIALKFKSGKTMKVTSRCALVWVAWTTAAWAVWTTWTIAR